MSYSVTQVEAMCCVTGWSANIEHHSIHPGQIPRAIRAMETEGSGMGTPERGNGWSIGVQWETGPLGDGRVLWVERVVAMQGYNYT